METAHVVVNTKEKAKQRFETVLGFNQPRAEDVVKRENFNSDAEYIVALTQMKMVMATPEYQKAARQSAREAQQQKEAELKKKQDKLYQKLRKEAVLNSFEEGQVEREARRLADNDIAEKKISVSEYGETVRVYTEKLTGKAKDEKAQNGVMNAIFRGEIEAMKVDEDGNMSDGRSFNDAIREGF